MSPVVDPILLLTIAIGAAHAGFWAVLIANIAYLRRGAGTKTTDEPSLSVCIPARNEAENLRRLLPSLAQQTYPDLEILVLDDGSEDETGTVVQEYSSSRITLLREEQPPDGWIGKVHALYQCTRHASGECYLFLDADAVLKRGTALRELVHRHQSTTSTVSTGIPHLQGGAMLLVSLIPHALLRSLPWPLVQRTDSPALSALNGQCWLIDAETYHEHEPHEHVKNAILEDVAIGRYLKSKGHSPTLLDVQDLVSVHMYDSYPAAWRGLRKNTYLLLGGTPGRFLVLYTGFILTWIVAPFLSPWFIASLYGLKLITDRVSGMSITTSLLAPVSYVLSVTLQLDSAIHHWIGQVKWKGRSVRSG